MTNKSQSYASDPGRISDLAQDIRNGTLSPVDLVQRYLDRITAVEPHVEAWRVVCADQALEDAAARAKYQQTWSHLLVDEFQVPAAPAPGPDAGPEPRPGEGSDVDPDPVPAPDPDPGPNATPTRSQP